MGLIRRPGKGDGSASVSESTTMLEEAPLPEIDAHIQQQAQDVMKDNLEMMKDIVMKIRHEEGYAKQMYANCPRLQHLLDKNPDLRPVFEDPRLVRINFESVYKEAGGVLPEDEDAEGDEKEEKKSLLVRIAQHPIFKFLKVLILLKKVIGCIAGGGIAAIGGLVAGMTDCCTDCCCEDALEELDGDDISVGDMDAMDMPMDPNQEALNSAADYMEDPEVQEQMQRLLEDPDNLADAIENDTELRSLRDSNPLCAELMQDPDTMRILVDPDNLRALGEAPSLIEADFADPGGFIPEADFFDIESGGLDGYDVDMDVPEMDGLDTFDVDYEENNFEFDMGDDAGDVDMDMDGGEDFDVDGGDEDFDLEEEEWEEDVELEEIDDESVNMKAGEDADDFEAEQDEGEEDEDEGGWEEDIELEDQEVDAEAANKGKSKGNQAKQKSQNQNAAAKRGGMGGLAAALGVAATDLIASQIVGSIFGDVGDLLTGGDELGGGPDLGAIEGAGDMVDDDMAGLAEDAVDDVEEENEEEDDKKKDGKGGKSAATSMFDETGRRIRPVEAAVVGGGATAGVVATKNESPEDDDDSFASIRSDEDEFEDEGESEEEEEMKEKKPGSRGKKKLFGALKDLASATATTAKESLAAVVLGDDFAEMLVEKQEEMAEGSESDEDEDDDEETGKKKNKKDDKFEDEEEEEPKTSKRRGLFRRK